MKIRKIRTQETKGNQNGGGCCSSAPQAQTQTVQSSCCGSSPAPKVQTAPKQTIGCC